MIPAQICDKLKQQQPKFPGILSQNGQMTLNMLKVKVNDPDFQCQPREPQEAYLVQICLF